MKKKGTSGWLKPRLDSPLIPFLLCAAVLLSMLMVHAAGSTVYPGDVNTDRNIDVSDAVLLARFCAEDSEAVVSAEGRQNADVNSDNHISGEDLIMLLQQIAKQLPMPPNPFETAASEPETTTESETTASTATAPPPAETQPVNPELTADLNPYPLGVSVSVLTGQKNPDEMLTVAFENGNIIVAIYSDDDPADTTIVIAFQDDIVGYYKACSKYTAPPGYHVREYRDRFREETGELYAITVLREDVSIRFDRLANKDDLDVLSKLNFYAVNAFRARLGIPCLIWHPELAKIARAHSVDMASHNIFEHTGSDGVTRSQRMLNAGLDYMEGGENIDRGQFDTFDALEGWLSSDSHRDNLLNSNFTHFGAGFAYDANADGCFYGTQDFCSFFPD